MAASSFVTLKRLFDYYYFSVCQPLSLSLCTREREGGGWGVRLGKEKVEAVFVVQAKHKQPHSSKMTTAGNLIGGGRT